MRKERVSDVTGEQILVGVAADDERALPTPHEDDGWAQRAVVLADHRMPVGAGGRHDEHVARPRVGEVGVADEDVAGLAVLADDVAARSGPRARSAISAS